MTKMLLSVGMFALIATSADAATHHVRIISDTSQSLFELQVTEIDGLWRGDFLGADVIIRLLHRFLDHYTNES